LIASLGNDLTLIINFLLALIVIFDFSEHDVSDLKHVLLSFKLQLMLLVLLHHHHCALASIMSDG
jgi:uncharacterized membrane protein